MYRPHAFVIAAAASSKSYLSADWGAVKRLQTKATTEPRIE